MMNENLECKQIKSLQFFYDIIKAYQKLTQFDIKDILKRDDKLRTFLQEQQLNLLELEKFFSDQPFIIEKHDNQRKRKADEKEENAHNEESKLEDHNDDTTQNQDLETEVANQTQVSQEELLKTYFEQINDFEIEIGSAQQIDISKNDSQKKNQYIELLLDFLNEERNVSMDSIKMFIRIIKMLLDEESYIFLEYILNNESKFFSKIYQHLSNLQFDLTMRHFLDFSIEAKPEEEEKVELKLVPEERHKRLLDQIKESQRQQPPPKQQENNSDDMIHFNRVEIDIEEDSSIATTKLNIKQKKKQQDKAKQEKDAQVEKDKQRVKQLQELLEERQIHVIIRLIQNMNSNTSNLDQCLTSYQFLEDAATYETIFKKLISNQILTQMIRLSCDCTNKFQSYGLCLLAKVIQQFPTFDKNLDMDIISDFTMVIGTMFLDLMFTCLLIITQPDPISQDPFVIINQAGCYQRKFGLTRLRALELIYWCIRTLNNYPQFDRDIMITPVLRKNLLKTMIQTMEEFQFSSIALQTASKIISLSIDIYDEEDVDFLIEFIMKHLETDERLKYSSGQEMEKANLGNILKIAINLRNLVEKQPQLKINQLIDDEDDEDESDNKQGEKFRKYQKNQKWIEFRQNTLDPKKLRWEKRLEDYIKEREEARSRHNSDQIRDENNIENLNRHPVEQFNQDNKDEKDDLYGDNEDLSILIKQYKGANKRTKQRTLSVEFKMPSSLIPNEEDMTKINYRDCWGVRANSNDKFLDNTYWRVPEQYEIDNLIQEQGHKD
ncbi:UNKNOWN [Stylonychia lemnae]|uniref:Uncharacterized protein n=1 Tax=Stylonychia lemnae TaxID=5949 RepID=A0A078A838_STYLE|nr:UNKNOWN [Stylonychia lemnae]|eukprot:CDW76941.1 UNKNOWN [Stylonychia lemnae]